MSSFEGLGVCPELIRAMEDMGWSLPRDVQDESIPLILGGSDVMIAAPTGSGKTGAFAAPILQLVHESLTGSASVDEEDGSEAKHAEFRLSITDRDSEVAVDPTGMLTQARHPARWAGVRSNLGVGKGKYMFEVTTRDDGLSRVGWSTRRSTRALGCEPESFGFGRTGVKVNDNKFLEYSTAYATGDTVAVMIDFKTNPATISFACNGRVIGPAFTIPPSLKGEPMFPTVLMKNSEVKVNFGSEPFAFPIAGFQPLSEAPPQHTSLTMKVRHPRSGPLALIIEPTRDLALQVAEEVEKLKVNFDPPINSAVAIGGGDSVDTKFALRAGPHVVVANIGRLFGLLTSRQLSLAQVRYLVIDEADALMGPAELKIINNIFKNIPGRDTQLQVIICSATLHSEKIISFADKFTNEAQWVDLKGKNAVPDTVDHAIILADPRTDDAWKSPAFAAVTDEVHVDGPSLDSEDGLSQAVKELKVQILLELLQQFKMHKCLIFCRTRQDCDNLSALFKKLAAAGSPNDDTYSHAVLHAGLAQVQRTDNLDRFREGRIRYLIASDAAARGIDISGLPYCISMTLPDEPEQYIHRVGRVGRGDANGVAISIVSPVKERVWFHQSCPRKQQANCRRRNLLEDKGCTIWYDEAECMQQIEKRLTGIKVPHLNRHNLAEGREAVIQKAAQGRALDVQGVRSSKHIEFLRPTAEKLYQLEIEVQASYFDIQSMDFGM